MVRETIHGFRNRIATIGTVSQRIERLAENTGLIREAKILYKEVQALETHLERFEKYVEPRDLKKLPEVNEVKVEYVDAKATE
jgi:hypothetical protein